MTVRDQSCQKIGQKKGRVRAILTEVAIVEKRTYMHTYHCAVTLYIPTIRIVTRHALIALVQVYSVYFVLMCFRFQMIR